MVLERKSVALAAQTGALRKATRVSGSACACMVMCEEVNEMKRDNLKKCLFRLSPILPCPNLGA